MTERSVVNEKSYRKEMSDAVTQRKQKYSDTS